MVRRRGKVMLNAACGFARGWQGRGGKTVEVKQSHLFRGLLYRTAYGSCHRRTVGVTQLG